jgi:hypothetical protein
MSPGFVTRSVGRATSHVPGIRHVPLVMLISMAEVGLLARDHLLYLTPPERRRLMALIRASHGRPGRLGRAEHDELANLVAKLEPRLLAGEAVNKFSPVRLPDRIVRGPRKRA